MKLKKLIAVVMTACILFTALSCGLNAYALVMCETQYTYDSPNLSWLKDLIVKEDMTSIDGLSQRNNYVPKAVYPYMETAASFKEEVSYYQALYTLDENMANVIYLYMIELVMAFADSTEANYSDEFIRSYLESIGIVYPTDDSEETRIIARAFFSVITKDEGYVVKRGTGLYEAFTAYISEIIGVDINSIIKFDNDSNLSDLKEYVLAACKYMLYSAGYNVNKDTSEQEVYRLIAIMTIRAQGISIDSGTATFEEIKNKYLCAMICKIYDVSVDYKGFDNAVKENNLAFHILQLMGKENGVTVKDSLSYEDAFEVVCRNTKCFNLEEGEFYADIYEYDVQLKYKRDTIWIYPQTLGVTSESDGTKVNVFINDKDVRENYYVDVAIDKEASIVPVIITVEYSDKTGLKTSSSYKLNIIQGKTEAVQGSTISDAFQGVTDIVDKVLGDIGLNSSIADIIQRIPFELPKRLLSIATLLLPSFDGNSLGLGAFLSQLFGYSEDNDSNVNTDNIGGVGGLDAFEQSGNSSQSINFGNLNIGNLNVNMNNKPILSIKPADTVVLPDDQIKYPEEPDIIDSPNWFEELIGDTATVVVLIVVMIVTFGVCLALFLKLFSEKNGKNKKEKE